MTLNIRHGNYIHGAWLEARDNETMIVRDKYNHSVLARLPLASDSEIEAAIQSAHAGFQVIRNWTAGQRAQYLHELCDGLEKNRAQLVDIIVSEAGKPRSYAEAEVNRCLVTLFNAATETVRITGETVPIDFDGGSGKIAFTQRFPIGPVLCITPFNFPLNLVLHKVAPALACGCSVIVKPAPQAPLSALFLAELIDQVGYPPGVANFVNCAIPQAETMVRDERIAMISFTGSEKVGWHLKNICGPKKVALELGGNGAVIIDDLGPDQDLRAIAKSVANGAFLYAGQICISVQRIYVVESQFEMFRDLLIEEAQNLVCGDPNEPNTLVGPMIEKVHLDRVSTWVDEALAQGAQLLMGGAVLDADHHLYQPTLLTGTQKGMKVVDEEVFGPVAILESVPDFSAAINRVNDSKFGLQAGVYTQNLAHMKQAHRELEVGGIMINNVPGFRIDTMPYGGVKMSGLGREGIQYAIQEMTEPRLLIY
ncbi:MAG: aldehyde dehydrogenase family protein [Acidobacteria bacterium]|nr:aldehyde dehydrogenase family protein [Acidobacteriota bacterium]